MKIRSSTDDARGMPQRILLVTPGYEPFTGGMVAFVAAIARRLVVGGREVTVLATDARRITDLWSRPDDPPLPVRECCDGVNVERLRLRYPWPAPYAFGVLRRAGHVLHRSFLPPTTQHPLLAALAHWMPPLAGLPVALTRLVAGADLVHAIESSWDGLFTRTAAAARTLGRPFVATPLMHLGDPNVQAHFQMAHQVEAYRAAGAVLALSEREAAAYARLGVQPPRIHRLAMGVDLPAGAWLDPAHGVAFRRAHGITRPLVAFLGANTYDKGAFTVALAVRVLNRAGLSVDVAFAGPGSEGLTAFLARQPDEIRAELAGHVHVLGLVDERTKHALLSACDAFALPSQVDTFGIVFLEAWLHGKPVIGARAGGIPELVREGETGLLIPFGDATALSEAIRRLLTDRAFAAGLGAAGRARTLQDYTWDSTYRALRQAYDQALYESQS